MGCSERHTQYNKHHILVNGYGWAGKDIIYLKNDRLDTIEAWWQRKNMTFELCQSKQDWALNRFILTYTEASNKWTKTEVKVLVVRFLLSKMRSTAKRMHENKCKANKKVPYKFSKPKWDALKGQGRSRKWPSQQPIQSAGLQLTKFHSIMGKQ